MGIQGELSRRHDKLEKSGLTIGAQASTKKGGRNQVSGRVSVPAGIPQLLQILHGNHSYFGESQARYLGHGIGRKSDQLASPRWSMVRMSFNIRERGTLYC